ncbi:MAG: transglutaminase-like domain-containing protein [Planctomycetaceae bacterium]|jgi:transglutaminase-like putative cysteine protease|nr:transglutaminase-like domain-containing protein [Planctomycetaceae bacterium]
MKQFFIPCLLVLSVLFAVFSPPELLPSGAFAAASSKDTHFLKDEAYRQDVHEQFEKRKIEAANRYEALFSVFDTESLSLEQREALEFLYAFMPLCDLADYSGEFFLKQVDAAFKARDYFSWGKKIPDEIFRHFVLVYRVNNENLDTARSVFFEELKDRVKNLSMYEAALEVNLWCSEKVSYRGTDARTSAPLALVRTSWGRCGEESTFTTTALRAVGIPARQCYTPRWAHTNDNHAWVEVWIDGKWHFLGACEPDTGLDRGWFAGPAKRAMMVHTAVFGRYNGPEAKNRETPWYSIINVLNHYAPVRTVNVQVTDGNNRPVEGATVQFKVYNYAELYPVVSNTTDKDGKTSIVSGEGDLMIWASKGDYYGYKKSEPESGLTVVRLDQTPGRTYEEHFVMHAPSGKPAAAAAKQPAGKAVTTENKAVTAQRIAGAGSFRKVYQETFISEHDARQLALQNQLNPDEVWKTLNRSQGNWQEIRDFIIREKDNPRLFPFIAALRDKELRDTPADFLSGHLQSRKNPAVKSGTPEELIVPYVLSPHIALELIQPWRSYLQEQWSGGRDVIKIIDDIKKTIEIRDGENYCRCPITPRGVAELKIADRPSRNIFFVAVCRSFGIPARIDTASAKPQYFENGQWKNAVFEDAVFGKTTEKSGKAVQLTLQNASDNLTKPGYCTHYTLQHYQDGDFQTLDYEDNPLVSEFPYQLKLDEGYYRLMAGSRAGDGSVTVSSEYFELKADKPLTLTVRLPKIEEKLQVLGNVDMNTAVSLNGNTHLTLKELSHEKGLMLCFLDAGKEPSRHILQDIPAVKQSLDKWGGGVLFMNPDAKSGAGFDASVFKGLPEKTVWGTDNGSKVLQSVTGALKMELGGNFPLTVYLSRNGEILYSSSGYKIGVGEEVLKTIKKEKR